MSWCVHYNGPQSEAVSVFLGGKNLDAGLFSVTISGLNLDAATQSRCSSNSIYYLWAKSRIRIRFVCLGCCRVRFLLGEDGQHPDRSLAIAVWRRVPYIACDWITTCDVFVFLLHGHSTHSGVGFWNFTALHSSINKPVSCSTAPAQDFSQALDRGAPVSPVRTEASASTESFLWNLIRTALIIEVESTPQVDCTLMHRKLSNYPLIVICAGKAFAERACCVLLHTLAAGGFPI